MPTGRRKARTDEEQVAYGQARSQTSEVIVLIRWEESTDVPILYANHFWVRLQEGQFLLTFGQAELPREDLSEERAAQLEREGLPVKVVSRLAVPSERIPQVIEALTNIHQRWAAGQRSQEVRS